MPMPTRPKICHILHVDRLASIIADGWLFCDATMASRKSSGTNIGMSHIKERRLINKLDSQPGLHVGDCVPFYFGPRSIMLFLYFKNDNLDLTYRGGQTPIIHLIADLNKTVQWANKHAKKWAFTLSNAGSALFEDRADLGQLNEINWEAVNEKYWKNCRDEKQAEFLVEQQFPWELISHIGVHSQPAYDQVVNALGSTPHRPKVQIEQDWYYS